MIDDIKIINHRVEINKEMLRQRNESRLNLVSGLGNGFRNCEFVIFLEL
jgi:hypothetical protein